MGKFLKGAVAAAVLAAGTVGVAAAPAQARSWHHGYHHWRGGWHHDNTGVAIGAGILGLGIGAAIASADRPDYYYGYDGYYAPPPPPPPPRYYYAPPPPPAYGYYYGYGW